MDWQITVSDALEQTGDFLALRDKDNKGLATGGTFIVFIKKALEILDPIAATEPDNQQLQSKKSSLSAKIEGKRSPNKLD